MGTATGNVRIHLLDRWLHPVPPGVPGELFGIIPYDFRIPDVERARRKTWDPQSARILTPTTFGVGWSVNLGRLARIAGIV